MLIFDDLRSRDDILEKWKCHSTFDNFRPLIFLEEAMIYGRWKNTKTAAERFNSYYGNVYADSLKPRVGLLQEDDSYLQPDGSRIYYPAAHPRTSHLRYLDELAKKLGLLYIPKNGTDTNVSPIFCHSTVSSRSFFLISR